MSSGARTHDQELGDILLAARLIDEATLVRAQNESQRTGRPLWRLLTRDSLVSEDALFRALRQEIRVPVLAADQLKSVEVPQGLKSALPHLVAQHLGILPLERSTDGRRAVLAMVDPTADITPIWPALTKLGVIEVRRFLVHLGTLRLGLEFFYGVPWQSESDKPEEDVATVQAVHETLARSAITQPIPPGVVSAVAAGGSSVMVDPELQDEFAEMDGPTDPSSRSQSGRKGQGGIHSEPTGQVVRSAITPRKVEGSSQSLRPIPPAAPASIPPRGESSSPGQRSLPRADVSSPGLRPVPRTDVSSPGLRPVPRADVSSPGLRPVPRAESSSPGQRPAAVGSQPGLVAVAPLPVPAVSVANPTAPAKGMREISLLELQASDVLMVEEQSQRFGSSAMMPEKEPVQDALMKASEALLVFLQSELRVTRPESLARLAQAVAERLGFAPRAVRELMLMTRLYGMLRLLLLRDGALPSPRKDMLGFDVQQPLMTALRELQAVLVDFIRLPTEPDMVPMGARIVEAVVAALELVDQGYQKDGEELLAKLRERSIDNEVAAALAQIVENDLQALGIEAGPPEAAAGPPPTAPVAAAVRAAAAPASAAGVAAVPAPAAIAPATAPAPEVAPAAKSSPQVLLLTPRPPIMPGVKWRTGLAASLKDHGLLPYTPEQVGEV